MENNLKNLRIKLIEEQKELSLRTEKLYAFIYSKNFGTLNKEYQCILMEQYGYMKNYLRLMNKRIALVNEQIKNNKK